MTAQEKWKHLYRKAVIYWRDGQLEIGYACIVDAHHIRREAALERALDAERRKVETLQRQRDMYEGAFEYACKDVIALKEDNAKLKSEIEIVNHANEEYSLLCDFKEDLL